MVLSGPTKWQPQAMGWKLENLFVPDSSDMENKLKMYNLAVGKEITLKEEVSGQFNDTGVT